MSNESKNIKRSTLEEYQRFNGEASELTLSGFSADSEAIKNLHQEIEYQKKAIRAQIPKQRSLVIAPSQIAYDSWFMFAGYSANKYPLVKSYRDLRGRMGWDDWGLILLEEWRDSSLFQHQRSFYLLELSFPDWEKRAIRIRQMITLRDTLGNRPQGIGLLRTGTE